MWTPALLLSCLLALTCAKKCTNPNTQGTTARATTTEEMTTPFLPAPTSWPRGRYALMRAGGSCPQFFKFKGSWLYQDTEDNQNANRWPTQSNGLSGPMKNDGYHFHYCSKTQNKGNYNWGPGNYCIHMVKTCPSGFATGSITWDDENDFNANRKGGKVPTGVYNKETTKLFYCCREDGDASVGISLPVTRPFYMYRFTAENCQKVRGMDVTEEVIVWDDEDVNNQDAKTGQHPMDSGSDRDHILHLCLYEPRT